MSFKIEKINVRNDALRSQMVRYRFWIFVVISVTYLFSYFQRSAPGVVGTEIIKEFKAAPDEFGFIGSMFFWAYASSALPAGILSDTWGARKTISLFVFIASIGSLVFGLANNLQVLAIGRFLVGFGFGFVYVAAMRIMSDWYKQDELATYSGILLAVGNIGAMISTAPLVALLAAIGWRNSFHIVTVFTVLVSILGYLIIRNKPGDLGFPSPQDHMRSLPVQSDKVTFGKALKIVFGNKQFYFLGILLFSYYGTFMGVGSLWAGPYLQNIYGLTKKVTAGIIMMYPLGMVFGCPLSGYISDKILKSRKKVLLWGCVLHTLCYIPLVFFTDKMSVNALYILFFWYGLSGGAFVSCFACAKESYKPQFAGTAVGALNIFLFVGAAFYQYVMGLVINKYPVVESGIYSLAAYKAAFTIPMIGLLIGAFVFAFFHEDSISK